MWILCRIKTVVGSKPDSVINIRYQSGYLVIYPVSIRIFGKISVIQSDIWQDILYPAVCVARYLALIRTFGIRYLSGYLVSYPISTKARSRLRISGQFNKEWHTCTCIHTYIQYPVHPNINFELKIDMKRKCSSVVDPASQSPSLDQNISFYL